MFVKELAPHKCANNSYGSFSADMSGAASAAKLRRTQIQLRFKSGLTLQNSLF